VKKKTPIPPDQVIKKDVILFNRSGRKRDESPEFIIPLKSSSTVRMKSFFNSVYATKKTPNKLKATPQSCCSDDETASIRSGQKTQVRKTQA